MCQRHVACPERHVAAEEGSNIRAHPTSPAHSRMCRRSEHERETDASLACMRSFVVARTVVAVFRDPSQSWGNAWSHGSKACGMLTGGGRGRTESTGDELRRNARQGRTPGADHRNVRAEMAAAVDGEEAARNGLSATTSHLGFPTATMLLIQHPMSESKLDQRALNGSVDKVACGCQGIHNTCEKYDTHV